MNRNLSAPTLSRSGVKIVTQGHRDLRPILAKPVDHIHQESAHTDTKDDPRKLQALVQQHKHTMTKQVHLPVEETVKVPVVRKEMQKVMEQHVIKYTKQVPVQKYKTVEETHLQVRDEVVNGKSEKRYIPVTTQRQIPFTDYQTIECEKVVQVPTEKMVTRKGYRVDRHLGTKVVELEQDHIYELRPVLVAKSGEPRVTQHIRYDHQGKCEHGAPVWEDQVHEGWLGRPTTPAFETTYGGSRPATGRPLTAGSVRGDTALRPASSWGALPQAQTG